MLGIVGKVSIEFNRQSDNMQADRRYVIEYLRRKLYGICSIVHGKGVWFQQRNDRSHRALYHTEEFRPYMHLNGKLIAYPDGIKGRSVAILGDSGKGNEAQGGNIVSENGNCKGGCIVSLFPWNAAHGKSLLPCRVQ